MKSLRESSNSDLQWCKASLNPLNFNILECTDDPPSPFDENDVVDQLLNAQMEQDLNFPPPVSFNEALQGKTLI